MSTTLKNILILIACVFALFTFIEASRALAHSAPDMSCTTVCDPRTGACFTRCN